jgi:transposase InsO family protein
MPWLEVSAMSLRQEFVTFAQQEGANIRALCRQFAISPKTGYKWLQRAQAQEPANLTDRSRRPHQSPNRTPEAIEHQVLVLRDRHPSWGGRKLHHRLRAEGRTEVPSPSTITAILRRHGRLDPAQSAHHTAWQRFEQAHPNDLWQIDFKGPLALSQGQCHALSVLDDRSRFLVGLRACPNQQEATVRAHLTTLFQRYGLPWRILIDNGPPWGAAGSESLTALEVWFLQLEIAVSHGRPYHPQTQGKVERFHGTLETEIGRDWSYPDHVAAQGAFDRWRTIYNHQRPHEAVGMAVPARHYHPSPRPFPVVLPAMAYQPGDLLRTVQRDGRISYRDQNYPVGKGPRGQRVALRPTTTVGVFDIYFGPRKVGQLNPSAAGGGVDATTH